MVKINEECLIFGDVAGQYDCLVRLLKKAPDVLPVSVGDMIDRGPKSKEVVEFFKKALMGNHEHFALDFVLDKGYYMQNDWFRNGGYATVESYTGQTWDEIIEGFMDDLKNPSEVYTKIRDLLKATPLVDQLKDLPLSFELDGAVITHAPIQAGKDLKDCLDLEDYYGSVIWNRRPPAEKPGTFQIFGHNSDWGLHWLGKDNTLPKDAWAVCLDSSREEIPKLTAMHWPSREIYQEPLAG